MMKAASSFLSVTSPCGADTPQYQSMIAKSKYTKKRTDFYSAMTMIGYLPSVLALALVLGNPVVGQQPADDNVSVGQEICTAGYVMDELCIDFGKLLDAQEFVTLKNPEEHTMHCLVDVPKCYNTPFHILSPPVGDNLMYGPGWAVSNNTELLVLGRQIGDLEGGCTTCDGTGTLKKGMRAEVRGSVATLNPPVLDVVSVKYLEGDTQGCPELAVATSDAEKTPDASGETLENDGTPDPNETSDALARSPVMTLASAASFMLVFSMFEI